MGCVHLINFANHVFLYDKEINIDISEESQICF